MLWSMDPNKVKKSVRKKVVLQIMAIRSKKLL